MTRAHIPAATRLISLALTAAIVLIILQIGWR